MNFEDVLVGKSNQIKKSFTQLWLLEFWEHGSGRALASVGLYAWNWSGHPGCSTLMGWEVVSWESLWVWGIKRAGRHARK